MKSIKPTILIFIDWYEPGYKAGGPIRSVANMVSFLTPFYNFKIVTRDTDYTDSVPYSGIKPNVWQRISSSTEVIYLSPSKLNARTIKEILLNTKKDFIYLNSMYSVYFSLLPLWLNKNKTQVILAPRGMLSSGSLGVKSFKKKFFLRILKWSKRLEPVTFQATSEAELLDIQSVFSKNKICTASNFPSKITESPEKEISSLPVRLINIGRVSPEKNNLFAIKVLKDLSFPVVLDFYGPIYDTEYHQKCLALTKSMPHAEISFKGEIKPNQIAETLKEYHFFLAPSTGENYGHAIVESLLNSTPVIISDKTPWRGLETANCGFDLPLDEEIFKATLNNLPSITASEKMTEMRMESRKYILEKINTQDLIELYRQLFF